MIVCTPTNKNKIICPLKGITKINETENLLLKSQGFNNKPRKC